MSFGAHQVTTTEADKISRFNVEVTSVGGRFLRVPDLSTVGDYVTELALASKAKQIILCSDALSSSLFLSYPTSQSFKAVVKGELSDEQFFETLKTAEIGVSAVDLAVAETGTLILATEDESDRLVTALTQAHVAIVPRSRLVLSLEEAESHISKMLADAKEGICISLVSASSRTSDIGDMNILGVHGPKELHVLLLEQEFLKSA